MKLICCSVLLALMGSISMNVHAVGSVLKIKCEDKDVGAEISINGVFKGECPLTVQVEAGTVQLKMLKKIDASHEGVFEQTFRMGDGVIKNIDAELSVHLTAEGQRHADERLAAEAARREEKRMAVERAESAKRAEAARLEEERLDRVREENKRAAGLAGQVIKDCATCPEMVIISSGEFKMGSANGDSYEKPVHSVTVNAFALGKTEVTQGQWRAVMGNNPSQFSSCGDDCPVEKVDWNDVQAFIQKLNTQTGKQYRLPSEAEWEYACRAGGQHEYCGSDSIDSVAWYEDNSGKGWFSPIGRTHPVSRKQPNAFGLYDMSGNVWEWMEDSWHGNYNGAPADGSVWQGDGAKRVLRGGSWSNIPRVARAANRDGDGPTVRYSNFGFRVARMLP
jgi:formylglycine-generating enzyme required for sulfatase activity